MLLVIMLMVFLLAVALKATNGIVTCEGLIAKRIAGHSVQQAGLPNCYDKLRIVCSETSHFTIQKSASLLGLGERAVHCVASNNDGSINITALAEALQSLKMRGLLRLLLWEQQAQPTMVLLTTCCNG